MEDSINKKSSVVQVFVRPEDYLKLKIIKQEEQIAISTWCRTIIRKAIKEYERQENNLGAAQA